MEDEELFHIVQGARDVVEVAEMAGRQSEGKRRVRIISGLGTDQTGFGGEVSIC